MSNNNNETFTLLAALIALPGATLSTTTLGVVTISTITVAHLTFAIRVWETVAVDGGPLRVETTGRVEMINDSTDETSCPTLAQISRNLPYLARIAA